MAKLPFTKMHGLGNDFIVIDNLQGRRDVLTPELAIRLCDRRLGIGADQILWLKPAQGFDSEMAILNSDGSTAEMCGNGVRAVGWYLHRYGPKPGLQSYRLQTLAGPISIELKGKDSAVVDMGLPTIGAHGEKIQIDGQSLVFDEVGMGNPHAVIFVPKLAGYPCEKQGPALEVHPRFPKRTNVEFVEITGPSSIRVRVWERGAGFTLACGTGACAAAVAALQAGRVKGEVSVELPGGVLKIRWEPGRNVLMEGPATEVFRGEYEI